MLHARPPALVTGCCLLAVANSLLVLLGWLFDLGWLKSLTPASVAMNPATAMLLIALAIALWLQARPRVTSTGRKVAAVLASVVLLVATVKLNMHLTGFGPAVDQWLFRGSLAGNQMAINTALCFAFLSASLLLINTKTRGGLWPTQIFAVAAAAISLLCLIGYAYGASAFYELTSRAPMALSTAIVFLTLAVGVLFSRPQQGIAQALMSEGPGGAMTRRLLPAIVGIPIVLGWLRLLAQDAGWYGTRFGAAFMVAATIILFLIAMSWIANTLNKMEQARREANEALEKSSREILELNAVLEQRVAERTAELADANVDLLQKNQENEMFVYSVSHDLRSPLVNLQGFSRELGAVCQSMRELLTRPEMPEPLSKQGLELVDSDMQHSIRFIQTAVTRLSNIIDALLRLSRAGRIEYRLQHVDVAATVQRIVESMHRTVVERDASIRLHELPDACGDAAAIEQVFANLIDNALKYRDPARPPVIEVGAVESGAGSPEDSPGWRTFFVKDNGLGISPNYLPKLFQAFKRFHVAAAPGEGMGLAIVRRIVQRHGGDIWVESTPSVGTTFFVKLPASAPRETTSFSRHERKELELCQPSL